MKTLLLFDVDGTIAESGEVIDKSIYDLLSTIDKSKFELALCGGGIFNKIEYQIKDLYFEHIFSECGSVYHKRINHKLERQYEHLLVNHELFPYFHLFLRKSLQFISNILEGTSGNFIDIRHGLIYISLVGLQANKQDRKKFYEKDSIFHYREQLLNELIKISKEEGIHNKLKITLGGSTGIAIFPEEWGKKQIFNSISSKDYKKIYYFGDKYEENGNDYDLIHHPDIIGIKINNIEETYHSLLNILKK